MTDPVTGCATGRATGRATDLVAGLVSGGATGAVAGHVPQAVVVVDRAGLVSHWNRGARRLFAVAEEEAVGRPAADLLPISGVLPEDDPRTTASGADAAVHDDLGPGPERAPDGRLSQPAAGRARLTVPGGRRVDVLWWAYPLAGPGRERLLVLAADANSLRRDARGAGGPGPDGGPFCGGPPAPGFAPYGDLPGAEELTRGLPGIVPGMSVGDSTRIAARIRELGHPVLDFGRGDRSAPLQRSR